MTACAAAVTVQPLTPLRRPPIPPRQQRCANPDADHLLATRGADSADAVDPVHPQPFILRGIAIRDFP